MLKYGRATISDSRTRSRTIRLSASRNPRFGPPPPPQAAPPRFGPLALAFEEKPSARGSAAVPRQGVCGSATPARWEAASQSSVEHLRVHLLLLVRLALELRLDARHQLGHGRVLGRQLGRALQADLGLVGVSKHV